MTKPARDHPLERPLPHSAESERALLGALILDNSLLHRAAELLKPDDFYIRAHYFIFRALLSLGERGISINPILLGEELRRRGECEQVGGIASISELTSGAITHPSIVADYAKLIREKSLLRQIA